MSRITVGWMAAGLAVLLGISSYHVAVQAQVVPTSPPAKGDAGQDLHMVAVDLLLVEVGSRKGEGAKSGAVQQDVDTRALTGPTAEVLAKVDALKKTGRVSYFRSIHLAAAAGHPASVIIGETKPWVTGTNFSAAGHVSRNIAYRSTGTTAKITARLAATERVLLDVSIEDSRLRVPEDGVSVGTDEKGQPIPASEMTQAKLDTKLSIRSGQAVAVQAVETDTRGGQEQTFVIVAARLIEPDAKRDK